MPPKTRYMKMATKKSIKLQENPLIETAQNQTSGVATLVKRKSFEKEEEIKNVRSSTGSVRKSLKKSKSRLTKKEKTREERLLEDAIAEIMVRRSSSSGSDSEDSTESSEEESDSKIYQLIYHPSKFIVVNVESEESASEETEYLPQDKLEEEKDFFEGLGYVPSMNELSEDESEKKEKTDVFEEEIQRISGDTGKFVDPLAGFVPGILPQKETSSTTSVKTEDQVRVPAESKAQVSTQETESSEQERRSYKSGSSDFSDEYADSDKRATTLDKLDDSKADEGEQETYLQFLELQQEDKPKEMEIDVEALLKEQQRILNIEQTMEFLNNLIDICVDKAEYIDEEVILRKNLDRDKVTAMLKDKLKEMYVEKKINEFLDRKCAEYYRRRNSVRHLLPDDNEIVRKKTFYENLQHLDNLVKREKETKVLCTSKIEHYRGQFEAANENIQEEIQKLEKLIKSTFQHEKFDKLKGFVNNQIHKMSTIRDDISVVRLKLFLEQHQFSDLSMQLTKLEDLGNGLNLKEYDNLDTETKIMGKKCDERSNQLKKLHHHCNAHIHSLAHIELKRDTMSQIVRLQIKMLLMFENKKSELRRYITKLSKKHTQSRNAIRQLSFQCGLLDKPNLMVDYDRTAATAKDMKALNDELKQTIANLTNKIALLEERCTKRKFKQK